MVDLVAVVRARGHDRQAGRQQLRRSAANVDRALKHGVIVGLVVIANDRYFMAL